MVWRLFAALLLGLVLYFLLSFRHFHLRVSQRLGLALFLTLFALAALLLLSFFAVFFLVLLLIIFVFGVLFFISRKLRLQ